ncbi:uncharacterized protein A1O9_05636 [Exophiala aquamarina CBS 119918]|uniref:NmrA-like domain-containing protein n=1 Tax=Exophiala aquamarina CBS 119918 TaxID=1182545 RepID=A0A072PEK7_9EURO|nr:uncharacterized protein A1O9_05636 [Exophiala aquamarina CBS 119918]KEF57718.1 hypothetical protein A1O9_05636 [Exophiala aquamarina CBS 119918]
MASSLKRVLIIGGTGAQSFAVVQALIEEHYTVRVFSRNPDSLYVKATFANLPQVEFVKGSFLDFDTVEQALQDCYGVYFNTDGIIVKESMSFGLRHGSWDTPWELGYSTEVVTL